MERPRLERRLRRIAHLVLALCVIVVAVAKLPGRRVYADANDCFANAVASLVTTEHHRPTRATAIAWVVWTGLAGVGAAVMSFQLSLFDHVVSLWPTHVLAFALGMLLVFVLLATPVIVIATRERVSDSSAIARSRSRSP